MTLLPSERTQLEAAAREVLVDLARSGGAMDEAKLSRTLHRLTGLRLGSADAEFHELLGRVGVEAWETDGVVLTAFLVAGRGGPNAPPARTFAEVAAAVGLLPGPSPEPADVSSCAAEQRAKATTRLRER